MRTPNGAPTDVDFGKLGDAAIARAMHWIEESKKYPEDPAAKLLSKILKHPDGLDFTVSFVDNVIRPEDKSVAAHYLSELAAGDTSMLPTALRAPFKMGRLAPILPDTAVNITQKIFARMVGDLVLDVTPAKLGPAIERLRAGGARLNMNLLGEAVLGDKEADKRLDDTMQLLKRDDVDYVSLKVSAVTGPHNPWAYDAMVDKAVKALTPLYDVANSYSPKKFVNLDMEEYKDLHMTIDVFKRILEKPGMENLQAGIVLQAYLPDSLNAMKDLQAWAAKRVANGGAPIKVRVVKGANQQMEHVEAVMHGWAMTLQDGKEATDANYMRVLEYALRPEHTKNVRIGVAGMNLFTVAYAFELAKARGVFGTNGVEFEMLSGMAAPQSKAVAEDVGPLLFYVPVVNPEEYDVAIAYLVRRLEENSANQNFMSGIFDLDKQDIQQRESERFTRAFARIFEVPDTPNRQQNRLDETEEDVLAHVVDENGNWKFDNIPDSDPALMENVEWSRRIIKAIPGCTTGNETVAKHTLTDPKQIDQMVERAKKGSEEWLKLSVNERAEILHNVGKVLALHRAELMTVAASEAYKPLDQGDVEVSEAVDFCHYYAEQSKQMAAEKGAEFVPSKVIVVTPPWNFPMAIPCGSTISALASGAAVIFKPAAQAKRTGAYLAELMWEAGVPKDVLQFCQIKRELGQSLMTNPAVDRVILTGSSATAERFRSWRPELGLMAETSGKNAIIVTPSADLDLAVKDIVNSAFGHAGQKCSASSLAILVGSVGRSRRVKNQLLDAVESMVVDYPTNPATEMSPIIMADDKKLNRGLTTLGEGERWAIKPRKLDDSGHLWSPGVRIGVQPGSEYHLTEYFGPILGIMRCETLEEAIELQNATDFGLTAGLHSLDANEINYWLDNVKAGNVYVNRGITGAIVRRQSFGGWKQSAVGATTKAGGPSYLYNMGEWVPAGDPAELAKVSAPVGGVNAAMYEGAFKAALSLSAEDATKAQALINSVADAFNKEYGQGHDPSQLGVEKNVLRYLPLPVKIRLSKGEAQWQLLGLATAGLSVGSDIEVSVDDNLEPAIEKFLADNHVRVLRETVDQFHRRIGQWAPHTGNLDGRIRLIGGDYIETCKAMEGNIDVAVWHHPVTYSGRVEVLPFVHEQAVAMTNHRFGNHTPLSEAVKIKSLAEELEA